MIKKITTNLLRAPIRLMRYLKSQTRDRLDLHHFVWRNAAEASATYVEANLNSALVFPRREMLWDYVLSKVALTGCWCEFGVFSGYSINYFAKRTANRDNVIYGFDSFEGLKEDWHGTGLGKGAFDRGGKLPKVLPNVRLIKGWFDKMVPEFLAQEKQPMAFVHLDADTYDSTKMVLELIADRIKPGTVIVFDEYLGFPNWKNGEFKAWAEHIAKHGISYRYLGFTPQQAAIIIK